MNNKGDLNTITIGITLILLSCACLIYIGNKLIERGFFN